jgi:hypothetical protein
VKAAFSREFSSGMVGTFRAKKYSDCLSCGDKIVPNDHVAYEDGFVIHADCCDRAPRNLEKKTEVCGSCFMEKSVSGDCGCT